MHTPRPRAVAVGSLSLFAVLFVLLTFQLSAKAPTASAGHTKRVAKAKPAPEPEFEATESGLELAEPEPEYAEPEPEYEYVEPEIEEVPPVVTSSS